MVVDRRTSTPLYLQLKDAILADIRQGLLRPGDRIGSETELERVHRVSRITVRQAINGLVQDGELYRVPGKGTYVSARKVAPVAAFTSFSPRRRGETDGWSFAERGIDTAKFLTLPYSHFHFPEDTVDNNSRELFGFSVAVPHRMIEHLLARPAW